MFVCWDSFCDARSIVKPNLPFVHMHDHAHTQTQWKLHTYWVSLAVLQVHCRFIFQGQTHLENQLHKGDRQEKDKKKTKCGFGCIFSCFYHALRKKRKALLFSTAARFTINPFFSCLFKDVCFISLLSFTFYILVFMKYSTDQLFLWLILFCCFFKRGLWLITTLFADLKELFSRIFTKNNAKAQTKHKSPNSFLTDLSNSYTWK